MEARPRRIINYQATDGKEPFDIWFQGLRDAKGKKAIVERLLRAQRGSLGHCDDVGEGVWGFKIDVGPGYRVYFGQYGPVLVILLCGGEKHRQQRDAALAKTYWQNYKSRKQKENEK
jgi:putative addiction module killer protein